MRILRILLRLFSWVQWLAAITVGTLCVMLQSQTLNDALGDSAAAAGPGDDFLSVVGPVAVSLNMTLPGLLSSVLLMLSAMYCHAVAR